MINPAVVSALFSLSNGNPGDGEKPVGNVVRRDWNKYVDYLEKKGLKGDKILDSGGLGYKLFDEYVSSNPETSLSRDMLPTIRKEFLKYRDYSLGQIKNKKANFAPGVTEDTYMLNVLENEKSDDPNYPGSRFASIKFPLHYVDTQDEEGKTVNRALLGYAKTSK